MQFPRKAFRSIVLVLVFMFATVGTVLANSITGPSSSQSPSATSLPSQVFNSKPPARMPAARSDSHLASGYNAGNY